MLLSTARITWLPAGRVTIAPEATLTEKGAAVLEAAMVRPDMTSWSLLVAEANLATKVPPPFQVWAPVLRVPTESASVAPEPAETVPLTMTSPVPPVPASVPLAPTVTVPRPVAELVRTPPEATRAPVATRVPVETVVGPE